ncbi:hypothetical protein KKI95_16720 [Xenorhabdus bovienii]|uniref:hypothetical protein n=1 Tax=Xenorhabdus bovienii TaxID=40576 RepID=UPI0023B2B356|nr:hypothetical protein [Xenorhabdus bovienii]MDE9437530.1 hypothetical protein [Xenorhabdus bovienii]MDE9495483.1 hypothetical protein [Xenorhabdus bovienii]MDE9503907.1 hypothetical protein [Xenorhabdus bovienii]
MSNIRRNEFGLSEELASLHAQIRALINTAHHTMSSAAASVYIDDTVNLLLAAKNLVLQAEQYRREWDGLISRERGVNHGYKHPL